MGAIRIERGLEIRDCARFVFDCRKRGGRANYEDASDAVRDPSALTDAADLGSDVDNVVESTGRDGELHRAYYAGRHEDLGLSSKNSRTMPRPQSKHRSPTVAARKALRTNCFLGQTDDRKAVREGLCKTANFWNQALDRFSQNEACAAQNAEADSNTTGSFGRHVVNAHGPAAHPRG